MRRFGGGAGLRPAQGRRNRLPHLLALLFVASVASAQIKPVDETSYPALIRSKAGTVVMVDFWATWCVPCRKEMPFLAKLAAKLQSKGLVFITVSADEPDQEQEAAKFLKQAGVTAPAYIRKAKDDDKFIRMVDPNWSGALPALMLYDRAGKRVKSIVGENPPAVIEAEVMKLFSAR